MGDIVATWTDPTGQVWPLSDTSETGPGWFTLFGVAGWGATSYEIVSDTLPRGGEQVRFIKQQPARVTWPLEIFGNTHAEFLDRWRRIKRAFTSTSHRRAPGVLRVGRATGTPREIDCWYEAGFGGEPGEGSRYTRPVLTLFCPDGYWRDTAATSLELRYPAGVDFFSPFLSLSPNQVLGSGVVTNAGDIDAWPTWTILGPMSEIRATHRATGASWTLTYPLAAGKTITVTTDRPTARGPGGVNLSTAINYPKAMLWPLAPDDNAIDVDISGSTTATSVTLTFNARYEGA